jgi:hypothetical protein
MIRCIRVLSLEDWSYLALLDHLLCHTFVPQIRYLGFTIRMKKGPLTTTGDLSACKSKRTSIQLLTVNTTTLVLTLPDIKKELVVYCDASRQGLGCVLMLEGKVVAYASR